MTELRANVNLNEAIEDKVSPSNLAFGRDYVSSMQTVTEKIRVLLARKQSPKCGPNGNGFLSCNLSI